MKNLAAGDTSVGSTPISAGRHIDDDTVVRERIAETIELHLFGHNWVAARRDAASFRTAEAIRATFTTGDHPWPSPAPSATTSSGSSRPAKPPTSRRLPTLPGSSPHRPNSPLSHTPCPSTPATRISCARAGHSSTPYALNPLPSKATASRNTFPALNDGTRFAST